MELGSNFELDISILKEREDTLFNYLKEYNMVYTDSGRSAIRLLNTLIPHGKVLLPSYICDSVIQAFSTDYEVAFYQVKGDLSLDVEDIEKKLDETVKVFYLMHYFGKIQDEEILSYLKKKSKHFKFFIIEDTTHSLLTSKGTIGDYCICSLRKWFPIADGGVLYSKKSLPMDCDNRYKKKGIGENLAAMSLKHYYIHHNVECNQIYRGIFRAEEAKLDKQTDVMLMSEVSRELLKYFSITEICHRRIRNGQFLEKELSRYDIYPMYHIQGFVPFTFPIFVSHRDKFKQKLGSNKIYAAVHWPIENEVLKKDRLIMEIARKIISLPIDQRYYEDHMRYLVKIILDSQMGEDNV